MSQYPYPNYQPATFNNYPTPDPRRILKRVAIMMFIIGGITAAYGMLEVGFATVVPMQDVIAQQKQMLPDQGPMPVSPEALRVVVIFFCSLIVISGVIVVALGFGVRKGNVPAITASIVFSGLLLAVLLLGVLLSIVAAAMSPATGGAMLCTVLLPTIAFAIQMVWLFKARKVAVAGPMVSQQMQMWQYQQMQQTYGQQPGYPPAAGNPPGYGYGYGYGVPQPQQQQPQNPMPQQQVPPTSSPSNPAGGSDVPPRQE